MGEEEAIDLVAEFGGKGEEGGGGWWDGWCWG